MFSIDRGRTFSELDANPVVKHNGRDPRLLWHEPTKRWIMAVFDESNGVRGIAFYSSPDLKTWTYESRIDDFYECPDLYALPVDGNASQTRWVISAADGKYRLGQFDGHRFTPTTDKQQVWYGNFYAAQTFSNAPEGRRIQIGWGNGVTFPGMPFNQQMCVPVDLTLRTTTDGPRLFAEPVRELESLRSKAHAWHDLALKPGGENPLAGLSGELFDIALEFEPGQAEALRLTVRGVPIVYDAKARQLSCGKLEAPLASLDGRIRLRVLVDRGSIEVFGNDGRVAISLGVIPPDEERSLEIAAQGRPFASTRSRYSR